jgi:hypothetical protein
VHTDIKCCLSAQVFFVAEVFLAFEVLSRSDDTGVADAHVHG